MSLNSTFLLIRQNVNRYFCPISLTLGLIGCSFNILLFSKKQFRPISCCTYFLAGTISTIMMLIVGVVPHIYSPNDPNPADRNIIFCKIRGYLGQSFAMMYRWLMTMACFDRCMVSSNNVYLREFSNPRIAYSIIMKIVIIWLILPLHNLIFLDIGQNLCKNSRNLFAIYHSLFTFILGGFLPLLIMMVSIILIRYNLASKRARRQRNIHHHRDSNESIRLLNARDQQVLRMLFIQVIIYIISTVPWMIFLLYASSTRHIINKSINRIEIEILIRHITEICLYIYPTLSFYIYTLTSDTFRGELINIICRLVILRDRSHSDPQSFLIQREIVSNGEFDQCQSMETRIYLNSSSKNDFIVKEQKEKSFKMKLSRI